MKYRKPIIFICKGFFNTFFIFYASRCYYPSQTRIHRSPDSEDDYESLFPTEGEIMKRELCDRLLTASVIRIGDPERIDLGTADLVLTVSSARILRFINHPLTVYDELSNHPHV